MRWMNLIAACVAFVGAAQAADHELIVCGWDEVFILDVSKPGSEASKVWSWKAADAPELPPAYRTKYSATDECKPVAGNRILITASSDGVALVERATRKTTFWAQCANAHSAELLPGERIAVACSTREPGGNRLAVFDARTPERELYSTPLYAGHGAVWDAGRKLLWANGGRELRAYSLVDWKSQHPSLHLESTYTVPNSGSHDLLALDHSLLALTTNESVWLFDRDKGNFSPHPKLGRLPGVKGISVHPRTGQIAHMVSEPPNWWTDTIRFLEPDRIVHLEGQRLYKVRWVR